MGCCQTWLGNEERGIKFSRDALGWWLWPPTPALDFLLILFPAGCNSLWSYRDKKELFALGHKHNCGWLFPLCLPIACFQRRKRSRRNSFAGHMSQLSHGLSAIREEQRPATPKESPSPPELSPDHMSTVRCPI